MPPLIVTMLVNSTENPNQNLVLTLILNAAQSQDLNGVIYKYKNK